MTVTGPTVGQQVGAEEYVQVQQFYARQMPLLDDRRFEEFLQTFTPDATLEHRPNGWRFDGRAAILAEMSGRRGDPDQPLAQQATPREAREAGIAAYDGLVYRYWFDKLAVRRVDGDGDTLQVRYQAMVSMTDRAGRVSFEPTTVVEDVLVRRDGAWYTRSRLVTHDNPGWADSVHNPS